jgi:hypothetical protein
MLFPASDFIPAWPWQAKHSWSPAGAAAAKVEAKDKATEKKAMRIASIYKSFL